MNNNLERLEAQLRAIFEENLTRLIPGNYLSQNLFDNLHRVMHDNLEQGVDGLVIAPDLYIIHVPPEDLPDWQSLQDILDEMADYLLKSGSSHGYSFHRPPFIKIESQNDDPLKDFSVTATISPQKPNLPDTAAMTNNDLLNGTQEIPQRAFLIVGGKDNFPLEKAVINIGRHSDNDLVLDEQHISRHHAQLRAIKKRFVIFDVGSTGGLFINGKRISQATLQPGDVIRIGLINLIFVQDITSENPTTVIPVGNDMSDGESKDK